MRTTPFRLALAAAVSALVAACGLLDNPQPSTASIQVSGTAGTPVQVILSKSFVAAEVAGGGADIQIFSADTLNTTLPVDTVLSISVEQQFYVQVAPAAGDGTLSAHIRIAVDNKAKVDGDRSVSETVPFRYVWVFNSNITSINQVI